jgi:hypothetical protein
MAMQLKNLARLDGDVRTAIQAQATQHRVSYAPLCKP